MSVKSWTEQITLPTYGIGIPGKNPVFLEKRVYQGSSGVVYPHPVITWKARHFLLRDLLAAIGKGEHTGEIAIYLTDTIISFRLFINR